MRRRTASRSLLCILAGLIAIVGLAPPAAAVPADYPFAGPVFGLQARGEVLFAADYGAGIVRLDATSGRLAVDLPHVTDVAPLGQGRFWAVTSGRGDKKLYFVHDRRAHVVANLGRFEKRKNPDGGEIDSNPFDVEALGGGEVLIADAGGNDLLIANRKGHVNWVATLPTQDVSTQNVKDVVGCPDPKPRFADICDLPDMLPAQPVPTSVAVGPDGAYYVTELKGFPAPRIRSRVWRLDPDIRRVECRGSITTNGCTVAARNLTSLMDINFDSTGTPYVVELDEASWFAVEEVPSAEQGGTVDSCDTSVTPWDCTVFSGGLVEPTAVALTSSDAPYAVVRALRRHPQVIALT